MLGVMTDTTPTYGFPFPNTSDRPVVPADMEALALGVEAQVVVTDDTATGMQADVQQAQADITSLQAAGGDFPAGVVNMWAGSALPPAGWLVCDGTSRSATVYPELFEAIRYTYGGSGDTFGLPNLGGRVPIGQSATYPTVGGAGGEAAHAMSSGEMPSHYHDHKHTHGGTTNERGSHRHGIRDGSGSGSDNYALIETPNSGTTSDGPMDYNGSHTHTVTTNSQSTNNTGGKGGSQPMSLMQPFLVLRYVIRH